MAGIEKILLRKHPFMVNRSDVSGEFPGVRQLAFTAAVILVVSDGKCLYLF